MIDCHSRKRSAQIWVSLSELYRYPLVSVCTAR
jgi:hypothetical protein